MLKAHTFLGGTIPPDLQTKHVPGVCECVNASSGSVKTMQSSEL